MKQIFILIFVFLFLNCELLKASQIEFQLVSYRGTGCPNGTLTAVASSDLSTYSFLFDRLIAEIPDNSNVNDNDEIKVNGKGKKISKSSKYISHKVCAINFSAKIPENYLIDSVDISFSNRGATSLEAGVEGRLVSRLMEFQGLAKSNDKDVHLLERKIWKNLSNDIYEDWEISPSITIPIKSQCAQKNLKKINFSFRNHLYVEALNEDATKRGFIMMDSSDMLGSLKFKIKTKKCGGIMNPPVRNNSKRE